MAAQVRAALGRLRPRDAEVIRLRYGLDDREHTLEEVGRQLGVTRERIRQIQKQAVEKLRALLDEDDGLPATTSDDVELAGQAPSQGAASAFARPAPAASALAVSQDTRTFIQNGSG